MSDELFSNSPDLKTSNHLDNALTPSNRSSQPSPMQQMRILRSPKTLGLRERLSCKLDVKESPEKVKQQSKINQSLKKQLEETQKDLDLANLEVESLREKLKKIQNNEQKLQELLDRERHKSFSPDKSLPTENKEVFDELILTKGLLRESEKRVEQLEISLETALDEAEDLKKKNESISQKISTRSQEQALLSQELKSLQQKDISSSAIVKRQQETIEELTREVNQLKELINGENVKLRGSVFGRQGTPVLNGARLCDISVDDPDFSMETHDGEIIGNDIILDLKESLAKSEDALEKKSQELEQAKATVELKSADICKLQNEILDLESKIDNSHEMILSKDSELISIQKDLNHEKTLHSQTVKLVNDLENEKTDMMLKEKCKIEEFKSNEREILSKLAALKDSLKDHESLLATERNNHESLMCLATKEQDKLLVKLTESIKEVNLMKSTIKDLDANIKLSEEERHCIEIRLKNVSSELSTKTNTLLEIEAKNANLEDHTENLKEELQIKAAHLMELKGIIENLKIDCIKKNENLIRDSKNLLNLQQAFDTQASEHLEKEKMMKLAIGQLNDEGKKQQDLLNDIKSKYLTLEAEKNTIFKSMEIIEKENGDLKTVAETLTQAIKNKEESGRRDTESRLQLERKYEDMKQEFEAFKENSVSTEQRLTLIQIEFETVSQKLRQVSMENEILMEEKINFSYLGEELRKEKEECSDLRENLKQLSDIKSQLQQQLSESLQNLSDHESLIKKLNENLISSSEKLHETEEKLSSLIVEKVHVEAEKSNLVSQLCSIQKLVETIELEKNEEISQLTNEKTALCHQISVLESELGTATDSLRTTQQSRELLIVESEKNRSDLLLKISALQNSENSALKEAGSKLSDAEERAQQYLERINELETVHIPSLTEEMKKMEETHQLQSAESIKNENLVKKLEENLRITSEKLFETEEKLSSLIVEKVHVEAEKSNLVSQLCSIQKLVETIELEKNEEISQLTNEKTALCHQISVLESELGTATDSLRTTQQARELLIVESEKNRSELLLKISSLQNSANGASIEAESKLLEVEEQARQYHARISELETVHIPSLTEKMKMIEETARSEKADALNSQREKFSAKLKEIGATAKQQYQKKLVELERTLRSEIESKDSKLKESSEERSQLQVKLSESEKKHQDLEAKYKAAKELIKKLQTELRNQIANSKKIIEESDRLTAELRSAKNELRNLKVQSITADAKIRELQQLDRRASSIPRSSSTTDSEGFKMPPGVKTINTPGRSRPGRTQSEAAMARRPPYGVGSLFSTEDEAGELFSESYLQDLKSGNLRSFNNFDSGRLSELSRRNSMYPPHLQSCYAAELQTKAQNEFDEDDLRKGKLLGSENRPDDQVKDLTEKTASLRVDSPAMNTRHHSRISNVHLKGKVHNTIAARENVIIEYPIPPPPTGAKTRKRRSLSSISTASNDSDLSFKGNNKRACRELNMVSYSKPGPPTPARKGNRSINTTGNFSMNSSNKSFASPGASFCIDETPAKGGTRAHDKTPLLDTTNQSKRSSKNVSISSRSFVKTPMTLKKVIYKTFRKNKDKYALRSQEGTPAATEKVMPPLRTRKL